MKRLLLLLTLLLLLPLSTPARAAELPEYTAPPVESGGAAFMPAHTDNFTQGLWELLQTAAQRFLPELREASRVSMGVIAAVLAASAIGCLGEENGRVCAMVLTLAISASLLGTAQTMVRLGGETVHQLANYGKLLFPVLASALAAQGGVTASAALYTGTLMVSTLLENLLAAVLVPMVYLFLALSVAAGAVGEGILKRMRDLVKTVLQWCLKTLLTVFTAYMSITGVISGTTDAAALKAARYTISTVVPVVGGILSDASESMLVGIGVMKNAAGVYGVFAVLAMLLSPFLRLGAQYCMLKVTAAVCGIFVEGGAAELIEDFSSAMGLLLAMTGASGGMLLIGVVCFLRGVG